MTAMNSGALPRGKISLGFGCAWLLHRADRRHALRLLETALDAGITYFDTARYYGSGAAEGILGEFSAKRRDRIIVVSKAGITPGSRSLPPRLANRAVLMAHKALPRSRNWLRVPTAVLPRFHVFAPGDFAKSVETSLRELKTSYLDILLLHECALADVENPAFRDALQTLKREGKIRAFGLATGVDETIRIANVHPELASVVQIPSNIWDMGIARLPARAAALTVTHSCFSGLNRLFDRLSTDQQFASRWRSLTHIDPQNRAEIPHLLLAHAKDANPDGIVLFSSTKPDRIRSNVEALRERRISDAQITGLESLIREESWAAEVKQTATPAEWAVPTRAC